MTACRDKEKPEEEILAKEEVRLRRISDLCYKTHLPPFSAFIAPTFPKGIATFHHNLRHSFHHHHHLSHHHHHPVRDQEEEEEAAVAVDPRLHIKDRSRRESRAFAFVKPGTFVKQVCAWVCVSVCGRVVVSLRQADVCVIVCACVCVRPAWKAYLKV